MAGKIEVLVGTDEAREAMRTHIDGRYFCENPEIGTHPTRLKEEAKKIRDYCERTGEDVIVITCNPYFVDEFKPEEIRIFGEDGRNKMMSEVAGIEGIMKYSMTGELWANYGEEKLLNLAEDEDIDDEEG